MGDVIACEEVRFSYDGDRMALDGVSLSVAPGELVCVVGGNGSGKSTLARHMNALLLPDEGRVEVCGHDTSEPDDLYRVRAACGMVFQNPDDQLVASVVEDDVAFGPENLGVPAPELESRVALALHDVGLDGYGKHETHALSGGQKQRVAIAGVLAMRGQAIVLDEASAMLDPRGRAGLMKVCRKLCESGMAVVVITHFMEEAAEADRVVALQDGKVALQGSPREVLTDQDALARLGLDVPFACRVATRLRAARMDVPACVSEDELATALAGLLGDGTSGKGGVRKPSRRGDIHVAPGDGAAEDDGAPLALEFSGVSFTYDASRAKRERKRAAKNPAPAAPQAPAKGARTDEAALPSGAEGATTWGNDPDQEWALRDVDLTVRQGEFMGLAGHTGSGKSTLIQLANGILSPTLGRVRAHGVDTADRKAVSSVRGDVGVLFQYPERQLFADTVFADVAFGPRNLGLGEGEVAERVREALGRVGLDADELRDKSPFELSGGQQRRVAFAGVLAMRPRTLVLDEPVAGLDPASRRDFLSLVRTLHERGLTVVMASHCMEDLAACCDRVAVLNEGKVALVGTPAEVFADAPRLSAMGLDVPAAQRLAGQLAQAGVELRGGVLYDEDALCEGILRLAGRLPGKSGHEPAGYEGAPADG